ncbi:unnamed protein product [Agarophyton chilense]
MDVNLMRLRDGKPESVSTNDVFANKKVALVTIPGALTSTCLNSHVPQWMRAAPDMRARGVDAVVCLAVNDPFVMGAFAERLGASDDVLFLADGGAQLTKAVGLDVDTGDFGGVRAKRGGFLVDDGVFTVVNVETGGGGTAYEGAAKPDTLLAHL